MTDNVNLIESVRDWPTITRMSHSTQLEKLVALRDALEAAEKAHTPTDDEREAARLRVALEQVWDVIQRDVRTLSNLDPVELGGIIARALDPARRSEVPEPIADLICTEPGHAHCDRQYTDAEPQGEPSDVQVLSDWFTSSHGVAVAAVKPMTDRGPSVMVDGRVISPNDVAALIEFKAQGEPSDAPIDRLIEAAMVALIHDAEVPTGMRPHLLGGEVLVIRERTDAEPIVKAVIHAISPALRAAYAVTEQGENRDE